MKKTYHVVRLDTSPYQQPDYSIQEARVLEELGMSYQVGLSALDDRQDQIIVITTSFSSLSQLEEENLIDRLALIVHPNSGYDNISSFLQRYPHIPVALGQEIRAAPVSEYIMSCLFRHFVTPPFYREWDFSEAMGSLISGKAQNSVDRPWSYWQANRVHLA